MPGGRVVARGRRRPARPRAGRRTRGRAGSRASARSRPRARATPARPRSTLARALQAALAAVHHVVVGERHDTDARAHQRGRHLGIVAELVRARPGAPIARSPTGNSRFAKRQVGRAQRRPIAAPARASSPRAARARARGRCTPTSPIAAMAARLAAHRSARGSRTRRSVALSGLVGGRRGAAAAARSRASASRYSASVSRTMRSAVNRSLPALAARPRRQARAAPDRPAAPPAPSPAPRHRSVGTTRPVSPSATASGLPPTRVATTARPARIASSSVTESPSRTEDSDEYVARPRSGRRRRCARRAKRTRVAEPELAGAALRARRAAARRRRSAAPRRGTRRRAVANASSSTCCAFCGVRLPTVSATRSSGREPELARARLARGARRRSPRRCRSATVTKRRAAQAKRGAWLARTASHTHTTRSRQRA